jgi:uncharacterized membrane protein
LLIRIITNYTNTTQLILMQRSFVEDMYVNVTSIIVITTILQILLINTKNIYLLVLLIFNTINLILISSATLFCFRYDINVYNNSNYDVSN